VTPLKCATFEARPWRWEVIVVHGGTAEMFRAYVTKVTGGSITAVEGFVGYCYITDADPALVWVECLGDVPTLVHELMHAVFGILQARTLKYSPESEEAFTYTVQDLLTQVLRQKTWRRAA